MVRVPEGRFVIEQAPVRDSNGGERGVVAEGAVVIGEVSIGEEASIWYNCVVRGDNDTSIARTAS